MQQNEVDTTRISALKNWLMILQSVLVHSAAGGVGIAAIQVAQLMDAEVSETKATSVNVVCDR